MNYSTPWFPETNSILSSCSSKEVIYLRISDLREGGRGRERERERGGKEKEGTRGAMKIMRKWGMSIYIVYVHVRQRCLPHCVCAFSNSPSPSSDQHQHQLGPQSGDHSGWWRGLPPTVAIIVQPRHIYMYVYTCTCSMCTYSDLPQRRPLKWGYTSLLRT